MTGSVRQEWPLRNTQLVVQESRRNDRRNEHRNEHRNEERNERSREHPIPAPFAPEYEYDDPFPDVRAVGEAQFSRSDMINGSKKKGRHKADRKKKKVHRYPAEPASQESQRMRRYPDVGDEAGYADQFGPADEFPDTDLTHFQPQPSNDYADEADPDYEDDGYGDDDDDEDDSSETRSRTFVASGTGRIPDDMRLEADDAPDFREAASDSFISDREREADRSIDLYKQHEAE